MRFILILIAGLVTAALVGGANAAAQILVNWNLTNFMLAILPAGAAIIGGLGALGVGMSTDIKANRFAEAITILVFGAIFGALTILLFYFTIYQYLIFPQIAHAPQMPFFVFMNEYFANITIEGATGFGAWLGYSDFLGGAVGGVIGASWVAGNRRQEAGVSAVPDWMESCAALFAQIAYADGKLSRAEAGYAVGLLRAHCLDHYEMSETRGDYDLDQFVQHMTAGKLEQAAGAQGGIESHIAGLKKAPQRSRQVALLGCALISLCDGELAPQEQALLRQIASGLGFSEAQLADTMAAAQAHIARTLAQQAPAAGQAQAPGV